MSVRMEAATEPPVVTPRHEDAVLVVVFNHRFERNLPVLDRIYGDRFPKRVYLMPFYDGTRSDVVPMFESSHRFHGFFAQARHAIEAHQGSHYVFIGDDLLLHPNLNATNLASRVGLPPGAAYIKSVSSVAAGADAWPGLPAFRWEYAVPALANLADTAGANWRQEMPSRDEAEEAFRRHGVEPGRLQARHFRNRWQTRSYFLFLFYLYKRLQERRRAQARGAAALPIAEFSYPLAKGYSDFFILPDAALRRFCRMCGVLAAMDVFVEIAIPTALLLCCERIVREAETSWRGLELWGAENIEAFAARSHYDLQTLFEGFPENQLYVHPIKLSRWQA